MKLASLRLICDQGKVLGVMPPQQARDEAAARGLLLLEVQAKAEPPIWKLVTTLPGRAAPVEETAPSGGGPGSQERGSAGKESTKRPANKEARIKELRLVDKSADHDVATKMNFARGQLEKGRIVQVRVAMRVGMRVGMGVGMGMRMHMHCACTPGVRHGHGPVGAGHDHPARDDDHGAANPNPIELRRWVQKCFSLCRTSLERTAMQRRVTDIMEEAVRNGDFEKRAWSNEPTPSRDSNRDRKRADEGSWFRHGKNQLALRMRTWGA